MRVNLVSKRRQSLSYLEAEGSCSSNSRSSAVFYLVKTLKIRLQWPTIINIFHAKRLPYRAQHQEICTKIYINYSATSAEADGGWVLSLI